MDILSNREWAIIVWFAVVFIYFSLSPKMNKVRESFGEVIKTTFAGVLVKFYCINMVYVVGVITFLYAIGFWQTHQTKNTLVWFFAVGLYSAFQVEKIKTDKKFLKRLFLDSFKLVAILQFILSIPSLNFFFELFIIPISCVILLASEISKRDEKLAIISKITNFLLSTFGLIFIVYAIYSLVTSVGEIDIKKIAYDFTTPPLLTLLYLPFLFILMLYTSFGTAFKKVDHSIEKTYLRIISKFLALLLLNVRSELVDRWGSYLVISNPSNFKEVRESFATIFYMKRSERHPQKIQKGEGWSPYIAKDFLLEHEITTGHYHPSFDEWVAYSTLVEFGTEIIPHNIAYYVEGTKDVANILKLNLNVNNISSSKEALNYFNSVTSSLYNKAIDEKFPEVLSKSILGGHDIEIEENGILVNISKDVWKNHVYNGFDIKFLLSIK